MSKLVLTDRELYEAINNYVKLKYQMEIGAILVKGDEHLGSTSFGTFNSAIKEVECEIISKE